MISSDEQDRRIDGFGKKIILAFRGARVFSTARGAGDEPSFSWHGIAPCVHVSPPFVLKDVPPKTARLRFVMHDKDAPHFHHGGSTIMYTGPQIAEGAISYIGPCPPAGQKHHYVWTIEALDAGGHVLSQTLASGAFPVK
ncbi:MAG TPA: phospholipid-binding protein [Methylovirgula sp.]